ncbi:hypothetical protein HPP92_018116 [Vanilla planifolia]|uniref:S-adenosyl-L-methionine-dependent methyltransferase n=1 Tax=Vanilla planifolia TaxID=51239 RepID=A0A835UP74_VANPL|nr:hypothetical protein HPP92_018704 [Vanilla planifolia]KAG0468788.1 hypothetical protein HPP92_018116 [Vanilla planifolia]
MSEEEKQHQRQAESAWQEDCSFMLSQRLRLETVQSLHATIAHEWSALQRTACQTAAARALWNHAIHDPMADVLAGESSLRILHEKMTKDKMNNAREVSGVILAVRTLWFDARIEAAISSFGKQEAQVVLLGAGMDARAYRLSCLKDCDVFEVDFPELLQIKARLIQEAMGSAEHQKRAMVAKSVTRVGADIKEDDWLEKLKTCGFAPKMSTVWVLEGILYYLHHHNAMQVLQTIAANCLLTHTVLLADFMNESSASLSTPLTISIVTGLSSYYQLLGFSMLSFHR